MSAADMQLVRDTVPGGYNLAVGEPFFLQQVYGHVYPKEFWGHVRYPPMNGEAELLAILKLRMNGQHVVVTNGAKQAIQACAYALRKHFNVEYLTTQAPYWPTYPTMAEMSRLEFFESDLDGGHGGYTARVLTAPNNPDGSMLYGTRQWDIWDAAYASPIYGWDYQVPWHKMSVWSAAKLFGLSGYRIGWLATPDPELAKYAAEYVEKTTSGVSLPSQRLLHQFLFSLETHDKKQLQSEARALLISTNVAFMRLAPYFSEMKGFPETFSGMFAWVKPRDPEHFRKLLDIAKVKVVGGQFCGGHPDWIRVSLGVLPQTMAEAVSAIQDADRGSP